MSIRDLLDEWQKIHTAAFDALLAIGSHKMPSPEAELLGIARTDCCGRRALRSAGVDTDVLAQTLAAVLPAAVDGISDGRAVHGRASQLAAEAAQGAGLRWGQAFMVLGYLEEGTCTASEVLKSTGVEAKALREALTREVTELLARNEEPEDSTAEEQIPLVVGPDAPPLDVNATAPSDALRVVGDAFMALGRGDITSHLTLVSEDILYSEYDVSLGKSAYQEILESLVQWSSQEPPEFAAYEVTQATGGVEWIWAGWWLTYPNPQSDGTVRSFHGYRIAVKAGRIVAVHAPSWDKDRHPLDWRACAICRTPLPPATPELLCAEHVAERDQRLAGPIPAAQLSRNWRDTLSRVAGLPADLRDEPLAASLKLGYPHGDWLIFHAGEFNRDRCLAWYPGTGEVRRYVGDVTQDISDYLDDLATPPPDVTDLSCWADPAPVARQRHFDILSRLRPLRPGPYRGISGRPFYGLPEAPMGMAAQGGGTNRSGRHWNHTERYEAPSPAGRRWLSVTSCDALWGRHQPLNWNQNRTLDLNTDTLWARLSGRVPWEPQVLERSPLSMTLSARAFTGEMLQPDARRPALQFIMRSPDVFLYGDSYGFTMSELEQHLRNLVDLGAHPEIADDQAKRRHAKQMAEWERENPGYLEKIQAARAERELRRAQRDPHEIVPTAFQQLRPELEQLAPQHPGAWLVSLNASFEENSWDGERTIVEDTAPRWWSASAWIGPERPRPEGGSTAVGWDLIVEDSQPETGVRLSSHRGSLGGRKLFKVAAGPLPNMLDSDAAFAAFERHGAADYRKGTGARLAEVWLEAEPDGQALWGARYQRLDSEQYLLLVIGAYTGELVHSEVTDGDRFGLNRGS